MNVSNRRIAIIGFFWVCSILLSYGYIIYYHQVEGSSDRSARDWPLNANLSLDSQKPTMVLAVHPKCPCTVATCRELARLLLRAHRPVKIYALVFTPSPNPDGEEWFNSPTMSDLKRVPLLEMIKDENGELAQSFGMSTSGDIRLYSSNRHLLFAGGITASRAHEGECAATDKLFSRIRGESSQYFEYPVFGCPITETDE